MKISLRTKAVFLLILTAVVISTVAIVISSRTLNQVVDDSYRSRASGVANSMAAVLDKEKTAVLKDAVMTIYHATDEKVTSDAWGSPEFDAYIARFAEIEQTEEFIALQKQLRSIQDVNDVDCIYLYALDPDLVVYRVDGWEGLMNKHTGRIITPAAYTDFTMISKELIKAEQSLNYSNEAIVMDRSGRVVKQ